MRILCAIATATIVIPLSAVAQDLARDITRQMGADTTTSVSQGLDRTGLHRDTETIRRSQQHAPSLLEQPKERENTKKLSNSERKRLLRKRHSLLKDRQDTIDAAAKKAEDKTAARKEAANDWDSKWGQDVQAIDQVLARRAKGGAAARFHAPALLNPK